MKPKKITILLLFISSLAAMILLVLNSKNLSISEALAASSTTNLILYPQTQTDIFNEDGNTAGSTIKSFIGSGSSTNSWLAIRFPVDQKLSTINKATIGFYSKEIQWIGLSTEIYVENSADSQTFSNSNKASSRKLSTSKIIYSNDVKWSAGTYNEIDITKTVQEVLTLNPNLKSITVIVKNTSRNSYARKFFETDIKNANTKPFLKLSTTSVPIQPVPIPVPMPQPVPQPQPAPQPAPPPPNTTSTVYVSTDGDNSNNGSSTAPFKTIQAAINFVNSNKENFNTISVSPGVYRESPELKNIAGRIDKPIIITSTQKDNLAVILGSESSQDSRINWVKGNDGLNFPASAQGSIYYADITAWNSTPEIAYVSGTRLNKAMEPDIDPFSDTSVVDNRWTAQGGGNSSLIDSANLGTINNFKSTFLPGARVFIVDGYSGHDQNTATITSVNSTSGQITFDKEMKYFDGRSLATLNSKYYVEGKPELLDNPGEWFYDNVTKKLYMWAPNSDSPAKTSIEFGVRSTGFRIINSQNILIKDFNIKYTNYDYGRSTGTGGAIYLNNRDDDSTSNITFDNVNISDSGFGIRIFQSTNKRNLTQNIHIQNSKVEQIDGIAFMAFNFPYLDNSNNYIPGVKNIFLENNNFKKGGYRPTGNGDMMWTQKIQNLVLKNNIIEESAHNGIEIQVSPESNVLVQNNIFKNNCLSGSDCGGFKIWGGPFTSRNILVVNNTAIGTKGCSFASKVSTKWLTNLGSGCGGFGFYTDGIKATDKNDEAVSFFGNLAESNYYSGIHLTKSSRINVFSNIISNNPFGLINSGTANDERLESSKITDNIFSKNSNSSLDTTVYSPTTKNKYDYALSLSLANESDRSNITLDKNLYQMTSASSYDVYTRLSSTGKQLLLKSVKDVQTSTVWEKNGRDVGSESQIPYSTNFSTLQLSDGFGYNSAMPQDVIDTISRLEKAIGISIQVNNTVGRAN